MLEWSADYDAAAIAAEPAARHGNCVELGGTIVLNIDMVSAPHAQFSPLSVLRPRPGAADANAVVAAGEDLGHDGPGAVAGIVVIDCQTS